VPAERSFKSIRLSPWRPSRVKDMTVAGTAIFILPIAVGKQRTRSVSTQWRRKSDTQEGQGEPYGEKRFPAPFFSN